MKRHALALLLAMAGGAHASEEDKLSWNGGFKEEGSYLSYAVPETDHWWVWFECERPAEKVTVRFLHEPDNAVDGMKLDLVLQAGEVSLPLTMVGERWDMDDLFVLTGSVKLDARLAHILTVEDMLLVRVDGFDTEISLDGARKAARPLMRTCR